MAYSGSTAASSLANPPSVVVTGHIGGRFAANSTAVASGRRIWLYNSSDATSLWSTPGYFTDGKTLGMNPGDLLLGVSWTTQGTTGYISVFGVLGSTNSSAGFNVSTDGTVTSTFT